MTNKFKVGDKVVPISKTIGCKLEDSTSVGKKFIYIVHVGNEFYQCWYNPDTDCGDFFMESDLIPYVEEFVLPEKWKIQRNKDNYKVVNEYYSALDNGSYTSSSGWCYSHKITKKYYGHDYSDTNGKHCNHPEFKDEDYQKITFEQFKTHVLKQNNMQELIGYKLKNNCKPYEAAARKIVAGESREVYVDGVYEVSGTASAELNEAGVLDLWFEPVYAQYFKVGDWAWCSIGKDEYLGKLTSIKPPSMDMWQAKGNVTFNDGEGFSKIDRLATKEEIQDHLVKLAKERGFVEEVKFIGVRDTRIGEKWDTDIANLSIDSKFNNVCGSHFYYNETTDTLFVHGCGLGIIYENGVWATITPQEKVVKLACSNNRDLEIKVTSTGITYDDREIPVSKLKEVLEYSTTFNGWTIKPEMFTIGCKKGIEREDLQKVLDTYNKIQNG